MVLWTALAVVLLSGSADAAPIINPSNGHSYELIEEGKSWDDARMAAADMTTLGQCHLATITSQAENDFVVAQLLQGVTTDVWIGGQQRDTAGCDQNGENSASRWGLWVTGEKWSFTNWAPNQPDDCDFCLLYSQSENPGQWDEEDCSQGAAADEQVFYLVECQRIEAVPLLSTAMLVILSALILAVSCWALGTKGHRAPRPAKAGDSRP